MKPSRLLALDGLRGIAALMVIVGHGLLHYELSFINRVLYRPVQSMNNFHDFIAKILLIFFNGETAVLIFFLLSGFVMQLSLKRLNNISHIKLVIIYCIKRLLRIFPLLTLCLMLFYALSLLFTKLYNPFFPKLSLIQILNNVLLLRIDAIGISWYLQTEFVALPFLLIGYFIHKKQGLLALILCFIYALFAVEYPALVFNLPNLWPYLFAMYLGMILADDSIKQMIINLKNDYVYIIAIVFIVGRHFVSRNAASGLIAQVLIGGFLIGITAYRNNKLTSLLQMRFFQYLGKLSFSVYLLGEMCLWLTWSIIGVTIKHPEQHSIFFGILSAVIALSIDIPLAIIFERFIEQPSITLSKIIVANLSKSAENK